MRFVAIIGAGELGATIARTLAARDSIPEIRLVDDTGDVAAGKALDIGQSGPVEGFHTRVTASRDIRAAAGAVVIVIADRATSGEWTGEPALALLEQLARLSADSMFVCAGADQMTVVDRSVTELGIARQRILGSAPGALVSAIRAMIALEARASPADITLSLVGTPPDRFVVTWREASLGGTPLANVLDASALDRLHRRVTPLWPQGPYALASAACPVIEALTRGSPRRFTCHVVLDGELGIRRKGSAFPVQLGPAGIERYCTPILDTRERVLFENAFA
jgi:malate dehydrogenase